MSQTIEQLLNENNKLKQQVDALTIKDTLLSEAANGYWQWDIKNNRLETSPQWKKSLLVDDDECSFTEADWTSRVHPDDLEHAYACLQAHITGKSPYYQAQYRLRRGKDEYIHIIDRGLAAFDENGQAYLAIGTFTDVTQLLEKERRLTESENSLNTIVNCMSEGVLVIDAKGTFIYANENFTKHVGLTAEQMKGRTPTDPDWRVIHEDGSPYPGDTHPSTITLNTGKPVKNDIQGIYKGDKLSWLLANSEPIINESNGKLIGAVITFTDITEQKKTEQRIQKLAYSDHLTGLANRIQLEQVINLQLDPTEEITQPFSVLFIDIDRFKPINDSMGHSFGDKLLCEISRRFKSQLRRADLLARFGGDEFVVVLPNTDVTGARTVASQLLDTLAGDVFIDQYPLKLSASIGICAYPQDADSSELLLQYADRAMYEAKALGGNQYRVFSDDQSESAGQSSLLELDLRSALRHKQYHIHYQPQIDAQTNLVIGAEALLRWAHPTLGNVPPDRFIPLAEQSGAIIEIGEWLIDQVCAKIDDIAQTTGINLPISINLSANQLGDSNLVTTIVTAINKYNLASDRLILEITETVLMSRTEQSIRNINELEALGFNLSIDDFGTGYSSLAYIKNLPVSSLKIDRAFIKDLDTGKSDRIIVKTIIDLADNLSLGIIAEGVETAEQLQILKQLGCNKIQGFYFSKPLPNHEFLEFIVAQQESNKRDTVTI